MGEPFRTGSPVELDTYSMLNQVNVVGIHLFGHMHSNLQYSSIYRVLHCHLYCVILSHFSKSVVAGEF